MPVVNNCGGDNNKGKTLLRAVVGLGLGLMIVSYVISVKSDLFRAQVVDGPITGEEEIVVVVNNDVTGEDLFQAPDGVATDEVLFAAAGDATGESFLGGAATDEASIVLAAAKPYQIYHFQPYTQPILYIVLASLA